MLKFTLLLVSINMVCFVNVIHTSESGRYRQQYQPQGRSNTNGDPVDCSTGFYIKKNPKSCTSFYMCDHGKPVLRPCGPGTEFSEEHKQCTSKQEAKCTVSQSGNSGSSWTQTEQRPGNNQWQASGSTGNNSGRQDGGTGSNGSNSNTNNGNGKFFYDMIFVEV